MSSSYVSNPVASECPRYVAYAVNSNQYDNKMPKAALFLEDGTRKNNPDAEAIEKNLRAVADDDEKRFVTVATAQDRFVQADLALAADMDYCILEYRDGSIENFFRCVSDIGLEAVIEVFQEFASGGEKWKKALRWRRIEETDEGWSELPLTAEDVPMEYPKVRKALAEGLFNYISDEPPEEFRHVNDDDEFMRIAESEADDILPGQQEVKSRVESGENFDDIIDGCVRKYNDEKPRGFEVVFEKPYEEAEVFFSFSGSGF